MTDTTQYPPFKLVYLYDPVTGEYIRDYKSQLNPLEEGVYITPIHHTEVVPVQPVPPDQVNVFLQGIWTLQPDYRGQTVYKQVDKTSMVIEGIGPIPTGYALTPPPPTVKEQITALEEAVDAFINEKATSTGYNSVDSMSKYITITDVQLATLPVDQQATVKMYRDQCQSFVLWVASVWAFCYNSENSVSIGAIPLPTKDQLLAALPKAPW